MLSWMREHLPSSQGCVVRRQSAASRDRQAASVSVAEGAAAGAAGARLPDIIYFPGAGAYFVRGARGRSSYPRAESLQKIRMPGLVMASICCWQLCKGAAAVCLWALTAYSLCSSGSTVLRSA